MPDNVNPPVESALSIPLEVQKRNFRYVLVDAIGVAMGNAASTFLPVFLIRLSATSVQVGMLTSMPGITGLLMALPIGRFLQSRSKIVPWFSLARLLVISTFALSGLVTFLVPREWAIPAVLVIWAFATLPQTVVAVSFSVVMNAVAGPRGRYDLMSKRWSIMGLTTAITVALVGRMLVRIDFPINYQVVFLGLSLGGLISYYFSSRIILPDAQAPTPIVGKDSSTNSLKNYLLLVRGEPAFLSFILKRFVYLCGLSLATPLFPLYYVRELNATDAWIGNLNTSYTAAMLIGYFIWARLSRRRGSRLVLLATTLGVSTYPAVVGMTHNQNAIIVYAAFVGIFMAGMDLVFFDELMKTVPPLYSPTFVSISQSVQYLSVILAPLAGTYLAEHIGLSGALLVSAGVRLLGFVLFAIPNRQSAS